MRFSVKKHKEVLATNIFGKPVQVREFYTIDRVCLGLFRFALRLSDWNGITDWKGILHWEKVYVKYTSPDYATQFPSEEDALNVLHDMKSNPDKYLRRE